MNNVAIISGLLGALLSAGLGFGVRWYLDRRSQRENERRVAYVHLISVSEIVAADTLVRTVLNAYLPDEGRKKLTDESGRFEPSHAVSAMIYEEVSKKTVEEVQSIKGQRQIVRLLRTLVDSAKATSISPDNLAKLPKEAILVHSQFLTYLGHVRQGLELWTDFFQDGDSDWLTAEAVHDNWLTLDRFCKQARQLRAVLVQQGACTTGEAGKLLKLQIAKHAETYLASMTHKPKVQAALDELQKEQRASEAA